MVKPVIIELVLSSVANVTALLWPTAWITVLLTTAKSLGFVLLRVMARRLKLMLSLVQPRTDQDRVAIAARINGSLNTRIISRHAQHRPFRWR